MGEWKIKNDQLTKDREETIRLIEDDVRAKAYAETGRTLEQEKKRQKVDSKKIATICKLANEVRASGVTGVENNEKMEEAQKIFGAFGDNAMKRNKKEAQERSAAAKAAKP